jgi:hypothetical protein
MKTGLIGNGYWGSIVQKKLEQLSELKFIADSKTDLSQIINDVDMVFVCSPTSTHYDIVKFCLLNNKNVFCEKPFTGSYEKASELFNLAEKNKLKIIIDHVFLYRNEYQKVFDGDYIKFIWNKSETIKQNIMDSLLYHDLYMLIDMTKCIDWKIESKIICNEKLYLKLNCNNKNVEIFYNRNCNYKQKYLIINNNVIDFSNPKNDALYILIEKTLQNSIDHLSNNTLCLETLNLKEKIYKYTS